MVDDKAVDDFLEHFGVKGMKWGQRKSRNEAARSKRFSPKKLRPHSDSLKVAAIAVGGTAAVGAGLVAANKIVVKMGTRRLAKDAQKLFGISIQEGRRFAEAMINLHR